MHHPPLNLASIFPLIFQPQILNFVPPRTIPIVAKKSHCRAPNLCADLNAPNQQ
ncbi:hypothetical protein F383_16955 [Gossypium arboreum]|uniref:Uncharacterized protein n=1 Tax=Gossypium arboreum TaxID=29729 RepID=A0A0B0NDA1_GOSAR|nr:hypothetical protein F383_16955 [Gossypium arboreum]